MPGYIIARVRITDPEQYRRYAAETPRVLARFGGRFLVRGPEVTTLEGPVETDRIVVIEFPSVEQATAFYASPEYQAIIPLRATAATAQFIAVPGYEG